MSSGNGRGWMRRSAPRALVAVAAVLIAVLMGAILHPATAWADDYPSWDDVKNARSSEKQQQALISQLQAEITQLTQAADAASADAQKKGEAYQQAETAYQQAAFDFDQKQTTSTGLQQQADASKQRAAQAAAQLARAGNADPTAQMLGNPAGASDLLAMLSFAKRMSAQQQAVYEQALRDQKAAQAASDQAEVAKGIREKAKASSEQAFTVAQNAAVKAQQALDAQADHVAQAQAQLTVLVEKREATEADYAKGVAARVAAAAAGAVAASGWARPASGGITSGYGYRVHPISHQVAFHEGTDLGAGCGSPIYAAAEGVVVYTGWYGGYGNYIRVDHGGGITTAYGHIVNGGILVKVGQSVVAGQNIAKVGSTGNSTGCHLHFETRINGQTTDPVPFMRGKGITLG